MERLYEEVAVRLQILLLGLSLMLKLAARTNQAFRSYIKDARVRILIKTMDQKIGRLFIFDRGTVTTKSGAKHACDAALAWSDSGSAFKAMLARTEEASFMAAAQGKLKVEGMPYYIQWFNDGMKLIS